MEIQKVYILVRKNDDMKDHMVEIIGVFKTQQEAQEYRQYVWDRWSRVTEVMTYMLTDPKSVEKYPNDERREKEINT